MSTSATALFKVQQRLREFYSKHARVNRQRPRRLSRPARPITRCDCPMRGRLIQHLGVCPVVLERRIALNRFYFREPPPGAPDTKARRRFKKLVAFWAWLRSWFATPAKEAA